MEQFRLLSSLYFFSSHPTFLFVLVWCVDVQEKKILEQQLEKARATLGFVDHIA